MSRRDKEFSSDPILKQCARQKPASHFILDFYYAELKLAIEVDENRHNEKQEYDDMRSELLKE